MCPCEVTVDHGCKLSARSTRSRRLWVVAFFVKRAPYDVMLDNFRICISFDLSLIILYTQFNA